MEAGVLPARFAEWRCYNSWMPAAPIDAVIVPWLREGECRG